MQFLYYRHTVTSAKNFYLRGVQLRHADDPGLGGDEDSYFEIISVQTNRKEDVLSAGLYHDRDK